MKTISIFEGKNKFSEVVSNAAKGEPQVITKNGKETAVVISYTDYKRLTEKEKPLLEFLLDNPARKYGIKLDLERSKDMGRPAPDFSEE
jgi:prevent-host-death family protein